MKDNKYDFVVYKTTEIATGKIYIGYDSYNRSWYYGSGTVILRTIRSRIKDYIENVINEVFIDKKGIKKEYLKKYGNKLFTKEILQHYDTMEEMIQDEPNWIKKFNATDKTIGYNIIDTPTWGDTFTNNPNKEERRKKLIEYYSKPENKLCGNKNPMFNLCGKDNPNYGRKNSSESIEKMKISAKDKHDGEKNGMFNKKHKESTIEIIKEKRKKQNNLKGTPVYQTNLDGNFLKKYHTMTEASEETDINISSISVCCKGIYNTAGGFIWSDHLLMEDEIKDKLTKIKNRNICQCDLDDNIIKEYFSINQASREIGISVSCISMCCRGKTSSSGGYHWYYKEDYDKLNPL